MLKLLNLSKLNENKWFVRVQSTTSNLFYEAVVTRDEEDFNCVFDFDVLDRQRCNKANLVEYLTRSETKNEVIDHVKRSLALPE